jgi:MGT family glycosyltransferase
VKVLAYTSPARGHLYPIVPILMELQRRGHENAVRTLASQVELMREMRIDAAAISERIEQVELDDYKARSRPARSRRVLTAYVTRAEYEERDLRATIHAERPDVLLIDINCWGAATVAEASGRPWAIYSPYLVPLHSREAPPFGLGVPALDGPVGTARDAILRRIANGVLDQAVKRAVSTLRTQHGLPVLDHFSDLLERPPLLLALTAEGFEYPRSDWPANVRLVGPVNWAPPLQTPTWLSGMQDPLVLVTCSSERQSDERLVAVALDALPAAGMSVIATTAAHDPRAFHAPAGSRVVGFLPHDAVLERAACVVCHGGMGITQKALAAHVPVVVVPFGRDQFETARRVEAARAGARLLPRHLTPGRLIDAVGSARERRAGAERVSRAYAAAGGRSAAADAIETIGSSRSEPCTGRTQWDASR